jgi:hypothetical protein
LSPVNCLQESVFLMLCDHKSVVKIELFIQDVFIKHTVLFFNVDPFMGIFFPMPLCLWLFLWLKGCSMIWHISCVFLYFDAVCHPNLHPTTSLNK